MSARTSPDRPTRCQADGCCNLLLARGPGRAPKWCGARCRRRQLYSGTCVDCGAVTNGYGGPGTAAEYCAACAPAAHTVWTRERLLHEGKRWRELTGTLPRATHWHTTGGGNSVPEFLSALLEFRSRTGPWPVTASVQYVFGSWGAFLRELGGEPVATCLGVKHGQRAAEMQAALDRLETSDGKPGASLQRDAAHGNAATLTRDAEVVLRGFCAASTRRSQPTQHDTRRTP